LITFYEEGTGTIFPSDGTAKLLFDWTRDEEYVIIFDNSRKFIKGADIR
jgi:hypothetical protein